MTTDSRTVEPTPGPWVVTRGRSPDARMVFVDGPDGQIICDCYTSHGEANARMIAAAPDMLFALQRLEDWLGDTMIELPSQLRYQLRDAVAKAEGRA